MIEIIKKTISYPCYVCKADGKKCTHKGCKVCDGKGNFNETIYYFIYEKNGKKYCVDSDNIG
jgi:RecJ-like exonuclease